MSRDLAALIEAYLRRHGPSTRGAIALAIRARYSEVSDAIHSDDRFRETGPPFGQNPRPAYFEAVPARHVTHKQRLLDALSDGQPHTHPELYGLNVMVHSRVADLRRDGHNIACWTANDQGRRVSVYQLLPALERPDPGAGPGHSSADPAGLSPLPEPGLMTAASRGEGGAALPTPGQLSLIQRGAYEEPDAA